MNLKSVAFAVVCCMAVAGVSNAQPHQNNEQKEPPTYAALLKQMDKNDDGKLSKSELKGPLKNDFSKVDTNEDGFITKKEFEKAPKPKGRERKN
ncbi:EF-hand domain-containing protein [Rasiella sp. SM2506]|uniref:EF-hand domain-containing protein n=1 Tax=Rasiella sp. SM2506 TaxID=3423914 RepID=UPI003D790D0A